ncbi:Exopolysaccharide biosynthesis protein [Clostridium cavendishii DSM 21758]|uniref:Exopolysaccharide biosynthesis protein n=1 Tax=Clostridium cavendishii DSM 21758 TaxID=1121302 RepID=A0A1M6JEJ1_9CLOT|nr:phosphodiester glycosidase family protein [Clostridium cavendishii]SHJ45002.1 Exopolysaccharide biosynthesis protein [Clostridium cavendishii DSM 21758]
MKKLKKLKWGQILIFIIFELLFTVITAPFILLYGPFENAKRIYVGSAMNTLNHQYLATTFLSKEKINNILNVNVPKEVKEPEVEEKAPEVIINKRYDSTIELFEFENSKYKGRMLIVKDPKRVKIGYTSSLYKKGETTSEMAIKNNAVAAINGGAFVDSSSTAIYTGNGGTPTGIIISDGEIVFSDLESESKKTECVALDKDGKMYVGKYSTRELRDLNVREAVTFYPTLIKKGKIVPLKGTNASQGIAPRTAIGQRADGSIVMMVIDGRDLIQGMGATMTELQTLMYTKGECVTALNLDGGKSATMYLNGEVINKVSNALGERYIATSIVVK